MTKIEKRTSIQKQIALFRQIFWTRVPRMLIETMPFHILQKFYARTLAKNWIFTDASLTSLLSSESYNSTTQEINLSRSSILHRDTICVNKNTLKNNICILKKSGLLLKEHLPRTSGITGADIIKRYAINIPGIIRYTRLQHEFETTKPNLSYIEQLNNLESFFVDLYQEPAVNLPIIIKLNLDDPKLIRKPSKPKKVRLKHKNNVLELVVSQSK